MKGIMYSVKQGTVANSHQAERPSSSRPISNVDEQPNKLSTLNWGYIDIELIRELIESKNYSVGVSKDSKSLLIFSQEPLDSIQSLFDSIKSPIHSRFNCFSAFPGVIQVKRQIVTQSPIQSRFNYSRVVLGAKQVRIQSECQSEERTSFADTLLNSPQRFDYSRLLKKGQICFDRKELAPLDELLCLLSQNGKVEEHQSKNSFLFSSV